MCSRFYDAFNGTASVQRGDLTDEVVHRLLFYQVSDGLIRRIKRFNPPPFELEKAVVFFEELSKSPIWVTIPMLQLSKAGS